MAIILSVIVIMMSGFLLYFIYRVIRYFTANKNKNKNIGANHKNKNNLIDNKKYVTITEKTPLLDQI